MHNWNRGNVRKATRKSKSWARSNQPILLTRVKFMAYVRKNYSTLENHLFRFNTKVLCFLIHFLAQTFNGQLVYQLLRTNWRNTFVFVPFPPSPPPFFLFLDIFGLLYLNLFLSFFLSSLFWIPYSFLLMLLWLRCLVVISVKFIFCYLVGKVHILPKWPLARCNIKTNNRTTS